MTEPDEARNLLKEAVLPVRKDHRADAAADAFYVGVANASAERIKAMKQALQGYVNECTDDECEQCIYARALLKAADR